jgi:hypothetical protein
VALGASACRRDTTDASADLVEECVLRAQTADLDITAASLTRDLFPTAPDGSALTDQEFAELLKVVRDDEDGLRLLVYRDCMIEAGWWCVSGVDDPVTGAIWEAESQAAAERGWNGPQPWQCRSDAGEVVDAPSLD